jgi:hypothetical protein
MDFTHSFLHYFEFLIIPFFLYRLFGNLQNSGIQKVLSGKNPGKIQVNHVSGKLFNRSENLLIKMKMETQEKTKWVIGPGTQRDFI